VQLEQVQVKFSLAMIGTWVGVFHIRKMSIGNVLADFTLAPYPPYVTQFGGGGTLTIGDFHGTGADAPIQGKVYFNVNFVDPTNCWLFAEVTHLTIQAIVRSVFDGPVLPAFIGNTGFEEALFSYNMGPDTVTLAGDPVPRGVHIKGAASLLGFGINIDLIMSTQRIHFYAEFDHFKFGPLEIKRSISDASHGPTAIFDATFVPFSFSLYASGAQCGTALLAGFMILIMLLGSRLPTGCWLPSISAG
jgi:hypothetical protein